MSFLDLLFYKAAVLNSCEVMFQRRNPRTILQNLKELFWPSMGWVRAFQYTKHRVIRLSDSTHNIALGLAIGAAISFTPILGTHFIQAGFIAYVVRCNFIAALIGTFIGILPGTGATAAAFISYADAKRKSPRAKNFGKGEPDGVIASETANNAVSGGAMIPMLALGIPGDGVVAIMMGALTIHGIIPGVFLFRDQPDIVTSIFILLFLANLMILLIGAGGASFYAKMLKAPISILMPVVVLLCLVGAFATRSNPFDFTVVVLTGLVGFLLRLNGFPMAPIIIGFILGSPMEMSLRQGLIMTDQNFLAFLNSPIALFLFALTLVVLIQPLFKLFFNKTKLRK